MPSLPFSQIAVWSFYTGVALYLFYVIAVTVRQPLDK